MAFNHTLSLANFHSTRNIYASKFGEEIDHCTVRQRGFEEEFSNVVFPKENHCFLNYIEDDLPKFHFPPKGFELRLFKDTNGDGHKSTEYYETDSIHSRTSTRANFTKDSNVNNDSNFNGIGSFQDIECITSTNQEVYEPKSEPAVVKKPQIEQLPTLKEIFNLKSFATPSNIQQEVPKPVCTTVLTKVPEPSIDANKQVEILTATLKPVKGKQDLAKRGDVVNKTLLRSLKRYYFTEFDSLYNFSGMDDKTRFAKFHGLVRKYVTEEMRVSADLTEEELESTIFFFGSMISHVHMRRGITISKLRTQVNSVYKCMYNYSHK